MNGGTVVGPGRVTIGDAALTITGGGEASFLLHGGGTLNGDVLPGQTLTIEGQPTYGAAWSNPAPFTNAGMLVLQSTGGAPPVSIGGGGALTNTGTITVTGSGPRSIGSAITNAGTIDIRSPTDLLTAGRVYTNTGTVRIAADASLVMNGGSVTLGATWRQQGGTLAVDGRFVMAGNGGGGTFRYEGGAITGSPIELQDMSLVLDGSGTSTYLLRSSIQLTGNVSPDQTLLMRGAALSTYAPFTNAGMIRLQSETVAQNATFSVSGGTATNTGTMWVEAGSGGARIITGPLVNEGTVRFDASAVLTSQGRTYTNRGTWDIGPGATVSTSGGSVTIGTTFNQQAGTLVVAGRLQISGNGGGGALNLNGGTITGGGSIVMEAGVVLAGHGTIVGDVSISTSTVNPDGTLKMSTWTQDASSTDNFDLGSSSYDRIDVMGAATLAGIVRVGYAPGFVPTPCTEFHIVTWGSRTGAFGSIVLPAPVGGIALRAIYAPNELVLVAAPTSAKIAIGPTTVAVGEGGPSASYGVCLSGQPSADVTVAASPDSQTAATPASVTFSSAAWDRVRTFVASAVDDLVAEGPHAGTITHASSSADSAFDGLAVPAVEASITDNDHTPVASDGSATTDEDVAVDITLNATDEDGQTLVYSIVSPPAHGSLAVDGAVASYAPDADYNGPDGFTFRASDGTNVGNVAAVSITVRPVNDPPDAVDDMASTAPYHPVTVNVLANDTDIDGGELTVVAVSAPGHGRAVANDDGTVTYTPGARFRGSDAFTYTITDGNDAFDTATVTIEEIGCGEDGLEALRDTPLDGAASRTVHERVEPEADRAGVSATIHDLNCGVVVPIEDHVDGRTP